MAINVIGLLNVSIDKNQYTINERIKIVSREFFENNNIFMPADIRFYKTFIVSEEEFEEDFDANTLTEEKKDSFPLYFLWTVKLFLAEYEIINSEWFAGESYETLKEFMVLSNIDIVSAANFKNNWINSFRIDEIVHELSEDTIQDIISLYQKITYLYKVKEKSIEDINLHWLYAFTKFEECCTKENVRYCLISLASALEFLLVNTSDESPFRSAYYAALVYVDGLEDRIDCYDFLKWVYHIRDKLSTPNAIDIRSSLDKSDLIENVHRLKNILSKILLKTVGLTSGEIQEKINKMIFDTPTFI